MPFGKKQDAAGVTINFDSIYQELIGPAIEAAGMYVVRADEEMAGGLIHKPIFRKKVRSVL